MRHPTPTLRPNRYTALLLALAVVALAAAPVAAPPCCADEAAVWTGAPAPVEGGSDEALLVADLDPSDLDDDDLDADDDALPAAAALVRACRTTTPLHRAPPADRTRDRGPASVFRPPRA